MGLQRAAISGRTRGLPFWPPDSIAKKVSFIQFPEVNMPYRFVKIWLNMASDLIEDKEATGKSI